MFNAAASFFRPYHLAAGLVLLLGMALIVWSSRDELVRGTLGLEHRLSGLREVTIETPAGPIPTLTGGSGEPLVLIHGFAGDKDNWDPVARYLNKRFKLWAPDLVGFGESPKDRGADYHIHSQAERIVAWADAAHIDKFHVGGNSMGGFIAGDIAANHPDRVLSAWLIDPAGVTGAQPGVVEKAYRENGTIVMAVDSRESYRKLLNLVFDDNPPFIPGFLEDALADQAIGDRVLRMQVFRDLADPAQPHLNELLPKIKAPVLLVWGQLDRVVDVSGVEVLLNVRPDIHTLVMPATGHSPMIDKPRQLATAFLKFQDSMAGGDRWLRGARNSTILTNDSTQSSGRTGAAAAQQTHMTYLKWLRRLAALVGV